MKTKKLITLSRIFLGVIFTFAEANGLALYAGFEPLGPTSLHVPEMQWLVQTEWLFFPEKLIELSAGILLLMNRFVPASLVVLTPICLAIFFFHLLFDRALMLNGIIVTSLWVFQLYYHKKEIKQMMRSTSYTFIR